MNKQIRNKIAQNEEGSGLVLALMVLLVLSVLGATLGVVTVGSYRLADHTQESNSAYYIAEAGANMAYEEIKKEVQEGYEKPSSLSAETFFGNIRSIIKFEGNYSDEFDNQAGNEPKASVVVEGPRGEDGEKQYTIVSTGEVSNKIRTVEKEILVNWVPKNNPNHLIPPASERAAITFFNTLYLPNSGNFTSNGNILFKESSKVLLNNEKELEDNTYNHLNFNNTLNITNEEYKSAFDSIFPNLENQVNYSGSLTRNGNRMIINDNTQLETLMLSGQNTIETTENTVNLWVDNLQIDMHTELLIDNTKTVNIFVEKSLSFGNNHADLNKGGEVSNLNIFYSGHEKVEFPGKFNLNGSLFIREADIVFSNQANINGMIITGGNTVRFDNQADINYVDGFTNGFPFDNTTPDSGNAELILSKSALEK